MGSDNQYWFLKRSSLKRQSIKLKEYKNSILIICEGEKTEPNYFDSFRVSNVVVKTIGVGKNTLSLIDDAIKQWKKFANAGEYFEKIWCVFDRDEFSLQNYNEAFKFVITQEKKLNKQYKKRTGRSIEIDIAYSNQAFELWYLLHYDYFENGMNRSQYQKMLTDRMGKKYKKNDSDMYLILEKLASETNGLKGQSFAIDNAKKQRAGLNENDQHNHNPSTKVDILVEELNKYLKK